QDHSRQGEPRGVRVKPAEVPVFLLELRFANLQPWGKDEARSFGPLRHAEAGPGGARCLPRIRCVEGALVRHLRRAAAVRRVGRSGDGKTALRCKWWVSSAQIRTILISP